MGNPSPQIVNPTPLFVLRAHRCEVSSLELTNLPLSLFFLHPEHYLHYSSRKQHQKQKSTSTTNGPCEDTLQALVSGDSSGRVIIWDLLTKSILFDFYAHTDVVLNLQLLCNGMILLTQGKEGTIKVWSLPKMIAKLYGEMIREPMVIKHLETLAIQFNLAQQLTNSSPTTTTATRQQSTTQLPSTQKQQQQQQPFPIIFNSQEDQEGDFDLGEYGYMLAETNTISLVPEKPTLEDTLTSQLPQLTNDQLATTNSPPSHSSPLEYITLYDLFTQCNTHIIFSFDSSVDFRLSVLITNSYTFAKMKCLFVEEQHLSKETLLSIPSLDIKDKIIKQSHDPFAPHSIEQWDEYEDDLKIQQFLSKSLHQYKQNQSNGGGGSTYKNNEGEGIEQQPRRIVGFDKPTSSTSTTTVEAAAATPNTQTLPHFDIHSSILDVAYLCLAPCENSSSLKIWRITFSFNLHSLIPITTNITTDIPTPALPLFYSYCDGIDLTPSHIQTLVIDKEEAEDEVSQDPSLAEMRRLNQFKSQPTLDDIDSKSTTHGQEEIDLNLTLAQRITQDEINLIFSGPDGTSSTSNNVDNNNNNNPNNSQVLSKSGLVMGVDVVGIDQESSVVCLDVLQKANENNHTQKDNDNNDNSLQQYQVQQLSNLLSFFATKNKQVLITAIANLYNQLLSASVGAYNHLEVQVGSTYMVDYDPILHGTDGSGNGNTTQKSSNTKISHMNAPTRRDNGANSDNIHNSSIFGVGIDQPVDRVLDSQIVVNESSSGLAKMLKKRQVDHEGGGISSSFSATSSPTSTTTTRNKPLPPRNDIKNHNHSIHHLFQLFINFLIQSNLIHDFLHNLFEHPTTKSATTNSALTSTTHSLTTTNDSNQQFLFILSIVTEGGHLLLYQLNLHRMFTNQPNHNQQLQGKPQNTPNKHQSSSTTTITTLSSIFEQFWSTFDSDTTPSHLRTLRMIHQNHTQHILNAFKLMFMYLTTSIYSTKHEYQLWLKTLYSTMKLSSTTALSSILNQVSDTNYNTAGVNFSDVMGGMPSIPRSMTTNHLSAHDLNFYQICANFERLSANQQANIMASMPPSMVLLLNRIKPNTLSKSIIYDQRIALFSPDHPTRLEKRQKQAYSREKIRKMYQDNGNNTSSPTSSSQLSNGSIQSMGSTYTLPSLFLIRLLSLADGSFTTTHTPQSNQTDHIDVNSDKKSDQDQDYVINPFANTAIPTFTSPTGLLLHRLQLCYFYLSPPNFQYTSSTSSSQPHEKGNFTSTTTTTTTDHLKEEAIEATYPQLTKYRQSQHRAAIEHSYSTTTSQSSSSPSPFLKSDHLGILLLHSTHFSTHLSSVNLIFHQRIVKDSLLAATIGNAMIITPSRASLSSTITTDTKATPTLALDPILSIRVILSQQDRDIKSLTLHANLYPSLAINHSTNALLIKQTLGNLSVVANATSGFQNHAVQVDEIDQGTNLPTTTLLLRLFQQSRLIVRYLTLLLPQLLAIKQDHPQLTNFTSQQDMTDQESHVQKLKNMTTRFQHLITHQSFSDLLLLLTHYALPATPENESSTTRNRPLKVNGFGLTKVKKFNNSKLQLRTGYRITPTLCLTLMIMQTLGTNSQPVQPVPHSANPEGSSDDDDDNDNNDKINTPDSTEQDSILPLSWSLIQDPLINNQALNAVDSTEQVFNNTNIVRGGYSVLSFTRPEALCSTMVYNPITKNTNGIQSPIQVRCHYRGSKHLVTCGWDHRVRLLASDIDFDLSLLFAQIWSSHLNQFIASIFANYSTLMESQYHTILSPSHQPSLHTLFPSFPSLMSPELHSGGGGVSEGLIMVHNNDDDADNDDLLNDQPIFDNSNDGQKDFNSPFGSAPGSSSTTNGSNVRPDPFMGKISLHNIESMMTQILERIDSVVHNQHHNGEEHITPHPHTSFQKYQITLRSIKAHYTSVSLYIQYMEPYEINLLWHKLGLGANDLVVGGEELTSSSSPLDTTSNNNKNNNDSTTIDPLISTDILSYYRTQLQSFTMQCLKNHINAARCSIVIAYFQYYDQFIMNKKEVDPMGDLTGGGLGPESILQNLMGKTQNNPNNPAADLMSKLTAQDPDALSKLADRIKNGESIEDLAQELVSLQGLDNSMARGGSSNKNNDSIHNQLINMMDPSTYTLTGVTVDIMTPGDSLIHYMLCQRQHVHKVCEEFINVKTLEQSASSKTTGKDGSSDGDNDNDTDELEADNPLAKFLHPSQKVKPTLSSKNKPANLLQQFESKLIKTELELGEEYDGGVIHHRKMALMFICDVISTHITPLRPGVKNQGNDPLAHDGLLASKLSQYGQQFSPGDQSSSTQSSSSHQPQPNYTTFVDIELVGKHIKLGYLVDYQQHVVGYLKIQQTLFQKQQDDHIAQMQLKSSNDRDSIVARPRITLIQRLMLVNKFGFFHHLANTLNDFDDNDLDHHTITTTTSNTQRMAGKSQQNAHNKKDNKKGNQNNNKPSSKSKPTPRSSLITPNLALSLTLLPTIFTASESRPLSTVTPTTLIPLILDDISTIRMTHHDNESQFHDILPPLINQSLFELLTFFLSSYDITNILSLTQEHRSYEIQRYDSFITKYIRDHTMLSRSLPIPTLSHHITIHNNNHSNNNSQLNMTTSQLDQSSPSPPTAPLSQSLTFMAFPHTKDLSTVSMNSIRNATFTSSSKQSLQSATSTSKTHNNNNNNIQALTANLIENQTHEYANRLTRPDITTINDQQYRTMLMALYTYIHKIQNYQNEMARDEMGFNKTTSQHSHQQKRSKHKSSSSSQQTNNNMHSDTKPALPLTTGEMRDVIAILQTLGCFSCYYADIYTLTNIIITLSYRYAQSPTITSTQQASSSTTTTTTTTRTSSQSTTQLPPNQQHNKSQVNSSPSSLVCNQRDNNHHLSKKQQYYINHPYLTALAEKKKREDEIAQHALEKMERRAAHRLMRERARAELKLSRQMKRDAQKSSPFKSPTGMVVELVTSSDSSDDDNEEEEEDEKEDLGVDGDDLAQPGDDIDLNDISLSFDPEFNTNLDIVGLLSPYFDSSYNENDKNDDGKKGQSNHLTSPLLSLLLYTPTNSISLLLHSITAPMRQNLLLLFHDGQISSFSLNAPATVINIPHHHQQPHQQQPSSSSQTNLIETRTISHLIDPITHQWVQNQLTQLQRPSLPEMATASSDGVIALWKKYF